MSNTSHFLKADFADWLNPMIVKELRQGLRTHGFVWRFIVVQMAMVFIVAMSVAAQDNVGARGVITFFFWFIIAIPLVFIIPNIGTGAVADERIDHTLEPILLTRLSTWHILFGKWLALVAQAALLVVTVLPYLVIRYYVGGINLLQELASLGNLWLASAVLTAAAIGLSPYLSRVGRIVITFLAVFGALFLWNVVAIIFMTSGGSSTTTFGGWDWPLLILIAAVFVVLFFEIGASRIAPLVSYHSLRMRLIGLFSALIAGAWAWLTDFGDEAFLMIALPAFLAASIAMLEAIPRFRPPDQGRNAAGAALKNLFFSRGWPSGVAYAVLLTLVLAGAFVATGGLDIIDTHDLFVVYAFSTLFFMPAVMGLPLLRRAKSSYLYVGIFVLCFALGLFLYVLKNASGSDNDYMFALSFLPPAGLLFAADVSTDEIGHSAAVASLVGLLAMAGLIIRALVCSARLRKKESL